ncbi:MAG: hypothetical protein IJH68_00070 [Thermoguttaceae bacterium]|nr:hypothetical protein [Thermoguttaceae bacterium]
MKSPTHQPNRRQKGRRNFLAAAALSPLLMLGRQAAGETIDDDDEVVLRFSVTSDVHFPNPPGREPIFAFPCNTQVIQKRRFRKMIDWVCRYSFSHRYPRLDAFAVNGDMTDSGADDERLPFRDIMDQGLPPETKRVLTVADHGFYLSSREHWEEVFGTPISAHQVIGGYHFITLSPPDTRYGDGMFADQIDWVHQQLKDAAADDPEKPIFFFQHYPVSLPEPRDPNRQPQWLYGRSTIRCHKANWGPSDLFGLFQEFPQVIDFAGDSHYPICDPGSAWQDRFSAFGTGSLANLKMLEEPYWKYPEGRYEYAQFYIVEVHSSGRVHLKIVNLATETILPLSFVIPAPGHPDSYLYTDARIDSYPVPVWEDGAVLKVPYTSEHGGGFRFEQTKNRENTQSYRITFRQKGKTDGEPALEKYVWSEFYRYPVPDSIEHFEEGLQPQTEYDVSVTPISFFGGEGKPITASFKTVENRPPYY